jgi:hypothetical protein
MTIDRKADSAGGYGKPVATRFEKGNRAADRSLANLIELLLAARGVWFRSLSRKSTLGG